MPVSNRQHRRDESSREAARHEAAMTTERIRDLNDEARRYMTNGVLFVSPGIAALPSREQAAIIGRVRLFEDFTPENDPHGEHDFGAFAHKGQRIFWKVDCYDRDLDGGSPEPMNPVVTRRVVTVMLAREY